LSGKKVNKQKKTHLVGDIALCVIDWREMIALGRLFNIQWRNQKYNIFENYYKYECVISEGSDCIR
jgi:hypothetical protein